MEDRYLFKAKRIDNGEWVVGYLYRLSENNPPFIMLRKYGESYEVDENTICQCTGLKDKNGKLIWENDIIECKDGKRNFQTQIEWDAYCAGFIFQDTETSAVGLDAITANGLYSESKVIGNIFDNKDLLESEE
jgi:uncharacterized phage protein (TIGR01671 family)|nr:MAG TPA: YopX protein [Bacteriophage sp.]